MTDLEKNLQEVVSLLNDNPLVKEYLTLKKQIEESDELKSLREQIVIHEKAMTQNMSDDDVYFNEKEIYEDLKSEYDNNPLIVNFNNVSEELSSLLNEIKDTLK